MKVLQKQIVPNKVKNQKNTNIRKLYIFFLICNNKKYKTEKKLLQGGKI